MVKVLVTAKNKELKRRMPVAQETMELMLLENLSVLSLKMSGE
jgi:hypothetical protein